MTMSVSDDKRSNSNITSYQRNIVRTDWIMRSTFTGEKSRYSARKFAEKSIYDKSDSSIFIERINKIILIAPS